MRWLGRLMASTAALLAAGGGVSAATGTGETPTPAEAAWMDAVKRDTLEAYAAFAMTFPESERAGLALRKVTGGERASLDGTWTDHPAGGYDGIAPDLPGTTLPPLWRLGYG